MRKRVLCCVYTKGRDNLVPFSHCELAFHYSDAVWKFVPLEQRHSSMEVIKIRDGFYDIIFNKNCHRGEIDGSDDHHGVV